MKKVFMMLLLTVGLYADGLCLIYFKKYIHVTNAMLTGLENNDLEYVDEIIDGDLKYYYYKVLENCDNSQLPKSFNDDYKKFRNFRMRSVE